MAAVSPLQGEKTDILYLERGDRLTGEIKKLYHGKLEVSTHEMKTVFIEWNKILNVKSDHEFEIELETGGRHFGKLMPGPEDRQAIVSSRSGTFIVDLSAVVSLDRFKRTFLRRVQIALDVGFSYAKANQTVVWDLRGSLRTRTRRGETNFLANSYLTDQSDVDSTTRNLLQINHFHHLRRRGFISLQASGEQNQELGLDLRLLLSGGFGYSIVKSNRIHLAVAGGLAETREWFPDAEETSWNTEVAVSVSLETYKFEGLESTIASTLVVYPSITTRGRFRIDFTIQWRIEVFKDFYWGLNFFDKFDSQPPGEGEKNDIGVSMSIGWSNR
jgi:hypothetical protein